MDVLYERSFMAKTTRDHLLSFGEIAQAPNKPSPLPLHEPGHVVAIALWRKRVTEHNVSEMKGTKEKEESKKGRFSWKGQTENVIEKNVTVFNKGRFDIKQQDYAHGNNNYILKMIRR